MKKLFFLLFLSITCYSQTKTASQLKVDLDTYLVQSGSSSTHPKGKDQYEAAVKSHSIMDMYFEGYSMIYGLTRAWQATGDFSYLDKALLMAEEDIKGAVYLPDFYSSGAGAGYQSFPFPYNGNVMLPNYYKATYNYEFPTDGNFIYFFPDLRNYNNNAPEDTFSHNYVEARDGGTYNSQPLGENIYYRYVADMLRVMNNNSSILTLLSNNGQTYQQRFDFILAHLENHLYPKWVEYEYTSRHKEYYVYRVNTHMSSHLPSIAVSLYAITGTQKYLDFVNEFLYDFGSHPQAVHIPSGVGLMDQLENINGNILWSNQWGKKMSAGATAQDVSHGGAEYHFLLQCYEEGLGATSPNGEMVVDINLINGLTNTFLNNSIPSSVSACDNTSLHFRIDGTGAINYLYVAIQGQMAYAQFNENILCHLINNINSGLNKTGDLGHAMYAARVHGIGGESAPVYPSTGVGGGTSTNNSPNVTTNRTSPYTINVGDTYTELGANWTDLEDGSGTITVAATGSVNTAIAGSYTLTYTYTDTGELSNTTTLVVNVNAIGNDCPTVESTAGSTLTLEINDTYTEQGGTWTDSEDGSGNATISGDSVDTTTAGTYTVIYSYTDMNNCTTNTILEIEVIDSSNNVPATELYFNVDSYNMTVGENSLPVFTISPNNVTIPYIYITSSDTSIVNVDTNGWLVAIKEGTVIITGITIDGTNLTDTFIVEVTESDLNDVLISDFFWNEDYASMSVGENSLPEFTTTPSNPTNPYIYVSSSDNTIISVDTNGWLKALKPGIVTISGVTLDGTSITDSITVEVIDDNITEVSFPDITIANSTAYEGNNLSFLITLSKPSLHEIILFATYNEQTTSSDDYNIINDQIIFAPGKTEKSIIVETINDNIIEEDETFIIELNVKQPIEFSKTSIQGVGTIQDNKAENKSLTIYPNPATSSSMVNLSGLINGTYNISFYSLSGQLIKSSVINSESSSNFQYMTPSLNPGLYIINVSNLENKYFGKIIIQ